MDNTFLIVHESNVSKLGQRRAISCLQRPRTAERARESFWRERCSQLGAGHSWLGSFDSGPAPWPHLAELRLDLAFVYMPGSKTQHIGRSCSRSRAGLLLQCRTKDERRRTRQRATHFGRRPLSISFNLKCETWKLKAKPKTSPIRNRLERSLSISPRYSLVAVGRPQSCFCCARSRVSWLAEFVLASSRPRRSTAQQITAAAAKRTKTAAWALQFAVRDASAPIK